MVFASQLNLANAFLEQEQEEHKVEAKVDKQQLKEVVQGMTICCNMPSSGTTHAIGNGSQLWRASQRLENKRKNNKQ